MNPGRCALPLALACVLVSGPAAAQSGDLTARFFFDNCASCHTVGHGDLEGPDLASTARWDPQQLHEAIERMQENVGKLDDAQVNGLVALLRDPAVQRRLDDSAAMARAELAAGLQPADAARGRELFYGEAALATGGIACFACHAVSGRGGSLAADLTPASMRLGLPSLLSAIGKPSFPLMRSVYADHAVSAQEAMDLAAFLEQAGRAAPPATAAAGEGESARFLLAVAASLAAALILLVSAATRRRSVRARLVAAPSES